MSQGSKDPVKIEKEFLMKALKSIVWLTTGVLALSACDMRKKEVTKTTTAYPDTTLAPVTEVAPAATATAPVATPVPASSVKRTSTGSGAISDDAASEDPANYEEEYIETDEEILPTSTGTGRSSDDYEYIDESSSEPNNVRGGRDPRMVPKNNKIDNTSSEPDSNQEQ